MRSLTQIASWYTLTQKFYVRNSQYIKRHFCAHFRSAAARTTRLCKLFAERIKFLLYCYDHVSQERLLLMAHRVHKNLFDHLYLLFPSIFISLLTRRGKRKSCLGNNWDGKSVAIASSVI
jgi:hypothetical protein